MHKVKGLEFDAVIVTPSFVGLPHDPTGKKNIDYAGRLTEEEREDLEEERRLLYVAYTRAKKKLSVYRFTREIHLDNMQKLKPQDLKVGCNDNPGIQKFFLSFMAMPRYFNNNSYIERYIAKNELLTIEPHINQSGEETYQIRHHSIAVGQLSNKSKILNDQKKKLNGMGLPILSGIFVSEVYVWTLEDTLKYDAEKNYDFIKYWSESAKQKGYIYIVDFGGYAR